MTQASQPLHARRAPRGLSARHDGMRRGRRLRTQLADARDIRPT